MAKNKKSVNDVSKNPTLDPSGGEAFAGVPQVIGDDAASLDNRKTIVDVLTGYKREADENRKGGLNPRDDKWSQNLDLYWNRTDFSRKLAWQAQETMPEVPNFVDRFAAALKEALVATPSGFYTVIDPADKDGDMAQAIKKMTDIWLSQAGRNQNGSILPFSAVFEEQMKLGALMACSNIVTWKDDTEYGRVAVETVDPRRVWLDHTYRNLYRVRSIELDRHELSGLAKEQDAKGNPIFNLPEVARMVSGLSQNLRREAEELTGTGQQVNSTRKPIVLDEYIATVVGDDGEIIADKALFVVADGEYLVRGPEKNPFWHGRDWMTFTPLITAPLSVYGRSYMEDFGSVAKTFTELTNMILDAVHTTSLKMYAMVPEMLLNPGQMAEGASPNKIWQLEGGYKAEDFAKALDMGTLPPESIKVWEAMKSELSNAAGINEIGLGQFAPNSRTSATEINETQQSSSALIRSVAQTVETRFLDPNLDLIWKTGLQHMSPDWPIMKQAVGEDMFNAIYTTRKELITRNVTFQARGISSLIQRSQMLKALLNILSVIAQSDVLMQQFLQQVDLQKLTKRLFELSGVDMSAFTMTEREKAIRSVTEPMQAAGASAEGGPPAGPAVPGSAQGAEQIKGILASLGVNK